ncbi:PIG-L family deacetylase [Candidatus Sumerlaeota bacterium]|nr:PIG-L family deacetylase [Candidatus Sumerlaeota bacterium]
MRILAVAAHPDDIEILCAGTLYKYKKQGHEIFLAHLCDGGKGHTTIPSGELKEIRKREAEQSAELLGAEIFHGEFPDLELYVNEASIKTGVNLIRRFKPDVLITHSLRDYQSDHRNTAQVMIDASYPASLPHYNCEYEAHPVSYPIFFMDCLAGIDFLPSEYVDISDEMELKKKMLLCHESQRRWLQEHHVIDYIELMKKLSAFRGMQCGVKYAEGFQMYHAWGRIYPKRILP